jgi:hypothetical protein
MSDRNGTRVTQGIKGDNMSKNLQVGIALIGALAVGGCGSSSSSSSKPPTKAQAATAAAAINLVAADAPTGYKGKPHASTSDTKTEDAALAACAGAARPDTGSVDDVYSEDFSTGTQLDLKQVASDVQVMASASRATNDLKAYQGDKMKGCLGTYITQLIAKQAGGVSGVTFGTPTVTKLSPQAPGTNGAFGYQVTLPVSAGSLKIPVELTV